MRMVSLIRLLLLCTMGGLMVLDNPMALAEDQSEVGTAHSQARKTKIYLSPYVLGTMPIDKDLSEGGNGFATQT